MNIALIIAGGSGQRMQSEIPKQFINVYDKPVLIYTLAQAHRFRRQNRAGIHLQRHHGAGKALWGNGSDFHP